MQNKKFTHAHTESTRAANLEGGSGGGLDGCFEMILISQGLDWGGALTCISGNYSVHRNEGKHLNRAMNVKITI
jgi:hypothetical protein